MEYPIPANEAQRLAALRQYDVLDTPAEAAFDRIARLAARMLDVPVATISLIDERRQWFKACLGISITETPREVAFCAHAIMADEVLVIPDAMVDPRFAGNPLVTEAPFVRFYAGAPLRMPGGVNIGTLCLIDFKPRTFSAREAEMLVDLAALAADELEFRQATAQLRDREAKFRALTENAHDIVTVLAPDGMILFESASIERVLGYRPVELVGRNAFEFVHADDVARVVEGFRRTGQEGAPQSVEFRFRHQNGSWCWLEAVGSDRSEDPAVRGVVVNSRDVTQRRAAEERLRLLESVVVNARDAILITEAEPIDLPGPRILYVNEAFTKMTGYEPEEVIGQTPRIFQGPKTSAEARRTIREALARWQPVVIELVNYHKDGAEFWVELSIVPVADEKGWFTHWVSVQRDVTERKATDAALRSAKEEAERANHAKSDFLSRMSHELRTPLNAILGFAQLLELEGEMVDQESVEQILKAGRHLLDLINEVLDLARIEAGRLSLSIEPVRIEEACSSALDIVRPLAAAAQISLASSACELFVAADRQRLHQVLLNLLSNAIKYNRPGGSVRIECQASGTEGEPGRRIRVAVTDTGSGISAESLPKLFRPFERVDAERGTVEGIGLGLALCKRLIELMGGRIGAESTVGSGSTFWFELAAAESPVARLDGIGIADAADFADAGSATILYIEDNLSNLRLIERILDRRPQFRLVAAGDGARGLALAREQRPDIILLDLHLPDMPGQEVLRALRADEATRQTPVAIVSADATETQMQRLLAAGAHAYLTKPLEVQRLLALLDETLQAHGERDVLPAN